MFQRPPDTTSFCRRDGLQPATQYKARVASGLVDTTGGILAEDYTWEFATIRPAVLNVWPEDRFEYMGPSDVISVTFNQPMDHASVEAGFSLEMDSLPVEGAFRWSGAETPIAPGFFGPCFSATTAWFSEASTRSAA